MVQAHNEDTLSTSSKVNLLQFKRITNALLERCAIPASVLPLDRELYDACKEIASSEFLLPSTVYPWFEKYLSVGVMLASIGYPHLPYRARVHVAIYTACLNALDDVFQTDPEHLGGFHERFTKGLPQGDPIQDFLVKILQDTPKYYGRLQTALIITSTLDFVTSLSVELEIREMKDVSEFNTSFAAYCRDLSGIGVAYAMFIFTEDVPFATYVPCMTHMKTYLNCIKYESLVITWFRSTDDDVDAYSDVLSFYKEELNGEEDNYASILAKGASITKYDAVQRLANDVAEADEKILKALYGHQAAIDSWKSVRAGFVTFHFSCPRYNLEEVFGEHYV
ncbi:hypothetical protein V5O48_013910 [Marasmius crinis-equi]|uniref:Terpenoid synthase n=1 Tax=Marasmius crinis-equi TaxID=585013 RepID=A0ABR3EYS8_9AGAR